MDMYNMGSGISQGNALTSQTDNLNAQIRGLNNAAVSTFKTNKLTEKNFLQGQKTQDTELKIFSGAKDAMQEGGAATSIQSRVAAYKASSGAAGEGADVGGAVARAAPEAEGIEMTDFGAEAGGEAAGASKLATAGGELSEGAEVLGDAASGGARVAGAIGKGAGLLGGLTASALDIKDDVESFRSGKGIIAGDNIAEKIANLGTIGGTALDAIGLIPGFQLAGVIGLGIQGVSGLLDIAGQAANEASKPPPKPSSVAPPKLMEEQGSTSLAGQIGATRVQ
tara:strand:+ start:1102 stop:1944 length:843 start_codon:yes stop_codon:yes gene_type:complete